MVVGNHLNCRLSSHNEVITRVAWLLQVRVLSRWLHCLVTDETLRLCCYHIDMWAHLTTAYSLIIRGRWGLHQVYMANPVGLQACNIGGNMKDAIAQAGANLQNPPR